MLLLGILLGHGAIAAVPPTPTSTDITAAGPNGALKGTITGGADKEQPVVLIIPGSGPTDRDGNNPLGVKAATYRLLAMGLAQQGIVTVRIDKRGMFASASAVPDPNAVTLADYAHDTNIWIETIRRRTGARCVWLLGHSEGGLVALATAAGQPNHICGLVLVSTAGRSLGEVLKEQLRANPANASLLNDAGRAIDALAVGRHVAVNTLPPPLASLFRPEVQDFLISEIAVDPTVLVRKVETPILIMQGERDIQVSVVDAHRLKLAAPWSQLALLTNTNHVLKEVDSDDMAANIATYANPDLPLAPNVVDTIARFVNTRN